MVLTRILLTMTIALWLSQPVIAASSKATDPLQPYRDQLNQMQAEAILELWQRLPQPTTKSVPASETASNSNQPKTQTLAPTEKLDSSSDPRVSNKPQDENPWVKPNPWGKQQNPWDTRPPEQAALPKKPNTPATPNIFDFRRSSLTHLASDSRSSLRCSHRSMPATLLCSPHERG